VIACFPCRLRSTRRASSPGNSSARREIGIRGLTIGRWLSGVAPERRASDIASVTAIATAHAAEFDVAGTYTLDQISAAAQHVNTAGKIGTVIVKI
jgi:hypothetical protein